ncbi:MAG: alpha/beta fold hydrolase [Actinomycetia bacterium]|nr:alpha/beta fold hydrolase [Actinomycetes bacterium]MCP4224623.1 alpha/beta fold hydrolase [Actinomycetes bacterium]MCP5033875.1 alpha/beta fold hydrolase [Actinomycetes bacterium]
MTQQTTKANDIELCFETLGDPSNPTLLLVMGFTAQMTVWPIEFCHALADHGFHIIRFDNRDVGLSTKTDGQPPDAIALMAKAQAGETIERDDVPYTLSDMADDAIGLLDALSVDSAHVVGASMGGMIAQHLAVEHPERLRSATSIMSTTGESSVGQPTDEAIGALLTPAPTDREANIARGVANSQIISGPLWNEADARARAVESYDRMFYPEGSPFQLAAILASGDRTRGLEAVEVPFQVIHGAVDSLIDVSGGYATAAAVPGADLLVLAAMGHDMPLLLWPQIIGAITGIAARG